MIAIYREALAEGTLDADTAFETLSRILDEARAAGERSVFTELLASLK